MKMIIHVNQHVIKSNRKNKKQDPVLTCKTYKETKYAHEAIIKGESKVVYRPDKPLSCGAEVWIECDSADVELINENSLYYQYKKRNSSK